MHWKIDTDLTMVVIGLGYVGLPTALAFSKKYKTIGVDTNLARINVLKAEYGTSEVSFESNIPKVIGRKVFIVTVPTPVNENKEPDLSHLIDASSSIAKVLESGDVVIYESTTFPGCTEEVCIPELIAGSSIELNTDFGVGYSPERINPGAQENILEIVRITSGSNEAVSAFVDALYQSILNVKTYQAPSIKIAEAAKLVENCQRDVNISFVNELALIFDKMGLSTTEVLDAARTKWNFLDFRPGLVGGHCISVDPYYMIHKSKTVCYIPQVIGAGRRVNEDMGKFVAHKCMKLMTKRNIPLLGSKALILGFAYKANCSDFRNTQVIDLYHELVDFGLEVDLVDPMVDSKKVLSTYGVQIKELEDPNAYDLIIHAVPHNSFKNLYKSIKQKVIFDVSGTWPMAYIDGTL